MQKIRHLTPFFLLIVAAAILLSAGSVSAVERPRQGEDILLDTYHRNMGRYHDRFERADGEWRFAHRHMFTDRVGDVSQHLLQDISKA